MLKKQYITNIAAYLVLLVLQTACLGHQQKHHVAETANNAPQNTEKIQTELTSDTKGANITLKVREVNATRGKNNFFVVTITANNDTELQNLWVRAETTSSGTLFGASEAGNKKGQGYKYKAQLDNNTLATSLYFSKPKGKQDATATLKSKSKLEFRIKHEPNPSDKKGSKYQGTIYVGDKQIQLEFQKK